MDPKEKQEISLIGRLLSVETVLVLMGLFSLGSGIVTDKPVQLFWGVMIVGGGVVLYFVRKKDWKKHWEEAEMMREREERLRREKEKK